uniref:class I SAM-dependent methyltransferase n=1 Tax=Streptomyces sp. CA-136453 TaxID=3240050 RepID=UPI003F49525A
MIINDFATAEYWNRAYKKGRTDRIVTPLETELFRYYVKAVPGMVAVDIGCGTGAWSRALASMGLSVTGYDISDVAVAEASSLSSGHNNLRFAQWDVNGDSIPPYLAPRSVDIITCRLTAAFLDRQRFLADAVRWLTPDGVVHIVTPVHEQLSANGLNMDGLTEREISQLGEGWKEVSRYNVAVDGSTTAVLLQYRA